MFNVTQPGEDAHSERASCCDDAAQSERTSGDAQSERASCCDESAPSEKADRSTEKDERSSTTEPPADNHQSNENNAKNVNGVSLTSRILES